ncbi:MAG: alpha-galactosidase [Clostridia bacterium]|nr:alpha-galactosidase [Clostridia bacterium]
MNILFKNLLFDIVDNRILLKRCGHIAFSGYGFVEVQIAGENKNTHLGAKMAKSSEGEKLRYLSHTQTENRLEIVQCSDLVEVKTIFEGYTDTNTVRVHNEVKNISDREIVLEEVSAFMALGIGQKGIDSADELYYTRFYQSHHGECQPQRYSFRELGLYRANAESQKRIACANIGSWSTKEELPQGIIEDAAIGAFTMFQIESNSSWYYEIADLLQSYYLYLGGANLPFGGWSKALKVGETYKTVNVALANGSSLEGVLGEMTKYRRHISGKSEIDSHLPTIFNEYMHLSWDSPTEENTRLIAPIVAKTGVEYYVIDCGWHNEEPGNLVYPYVGQWKESKTRFPNGVRKTCDFIRSLGMKPGLWIEPEIIGIQCQEMLDYYDDDCFLQRNGRRIAVMNRYFLDYRNEKVRAYMTETIRRMVEDYGAAYIKFDYNQDCGVGTDYCAFCAGEGLEMCANAYMVWVKEMIDRFPQVIFEGCSSGGMRMDYKTLSTFSIMSTSDQTDYAKYPYIAGNILSAVLPEQAAVWSYPVGVTMPGEPMTRDAFWVQENISDERIVMNMINSFLGRMHLASHLEKLSDRQLALIKEGVEYYNSLTEYKKKALPYLPKGFTHFGAEQVVSGFKCGDKIFLAAWCLGETLKMEIPLKEGIIDVKIAYPSDAGAAYTYTENTLAVEFESSNSAVFFEIKCNV